jgi:hypothetical protein
VKTRNPQDNQQTEGKRKGKGKRVRGVMIKKDANNVGEGKNEKKKVTFLCNICTNNHLTQQFP